MATSLTKREISVAELTGQGLSNKQIARELRISEHTVKNHLFHIFAKLNVANRVELLFLMVKGRNARYGELAQFFWGEGFNPDAVRQQRRGFSPRSSCSDWHTWREGEQKKTIARLITGCAWLR
jgi:DNA-binding CsgD family transcriptional regulator